MRELVVLGVGAITILVGAAALYRPRTFRSPAQRWGTRILIIVVLAVMWAAAAAYSTLESLPH
jgi:hypothetical protein